MIVEWPKLAKHYEEAARYMSQWEAVHSAMAQLCYYVEALPRNGGLYGHTSHHKLRIAQVEYTHPPDPSIPWLTIEPVSENEIEFCYLDTQRKDRQWRRVEAADNVIERFKKTLNQLSWSTSELP